MSTCLISRLQKRVSKTLNPNPKNGTTKELPTIRRKQNSKHM
jgi:hypothetical protein